MDDAGKENTRRTLNCCGQVAVELARGAGRETTGQACCVGVERGGLHGRDDEGEDEEDDRRLHCRWQASTGGRKDEDEEGRRQKVEGERGQRRRHKGAEVKWGRLYAGALHREFIKMTGRGMFG